MQKLYPLPASLKSCKFEELLILFVNVLYPKIATKLLLVDILSRIPLKGMEDFPWTVARVENINKNLKDRGIVNAHFKPNVEDGHKLVCYLLQFEEGRMLAEHLPSRLRTSKQSISAADIDLTQARVSIYLNSEKAEVALRKINNKIEVLPFYSKNSPDNFFNKLRPNLRLFIIRNMLYAYFFSPLKENSFSFLPEYVQVLGFENLTPFLLDYLLFYQGDLKQFQNIAKAMGRNFEAEFEYKMYSLVCQFLSAKSSEECLQISKEFKDLHKALKKSSENNRITFPFPVDYFYLFSLLKAYTNLAHKDAVKKDYFAYLKHSGLSSAEMQLFEHLIHENLSERMIVYLVQNALEEEDVSAIKAVLFFLVLYRLPREKMRDMWYVRALKNYFAKTKDVAPLVASFYAQFLSKLLPELEAKSYLNYLKKQDIFNLTSLFAEELSWEARMQAIYDFMQNKEEGSKKKISKNPKRLAWFVHIGFREVYPYEQSYSKEAWTRGRKVSALKLRDETDSYNYLTEQDKAVIKTSVKKDYWSDTYYVNFDTALPLLVDHPFVFEERSNENIYFNLHEPELEIEHLKHEKGKEESYNLLFSLPTMQAGLYVKESDISNTYDIIPVKPAHIKLKELMGEERLTLPKKAHTMLFDILSQEESPIKVRTKMEFSALPESEVNSQPTLRLKRTHLKNEIGLEIQAVVYPLQKHSTSFIPTKGADSFVAKLEDRPFKVERKFEEEKANIDKLLHKSQILRENLLNENYFWEFENTQDAYQVLTDLQESEITFEWYNSEAIKISKTLQKDDMQIKVRAKNNWFSLDATVNIDEDLVISMRSLLKNAAKHKGRFIPLANGQVLALAEDFKKALDKLSVITQEDKEDVLLHALAIPALQNIFEEEIIESDEKWLEWKDKLSLLDEDILLPKGINAELRPYQEEGFRWLASLVKINAGACLADDMGLGKTLQTIALLVHLSQENNEIQEDALSSSKKPFLIVAPTSVCHNWEAELKRFAPQLNVHRITASYSKKERKKIIENLEDNSILIVGYALLNAELESLLGYEFKLIVFDEAQALKNPQAIRTKTSYKLKAMSKLALTGTPVENSLDDLWSIFNIINPGLLGSLESFNQRFNPSSLAPEAVKNNARNNLKSLVKPFILRRTKKAVLEELPPRTEQTLLIEPSEEEKALYEALRRQAVENIEKARQEGEKSLHFHMLAELTKLRQACCNPLLLDPLSEVESSKLDLLLKLVVDLRANNHQALIFSQFTSHLGIVFKAIENLGIKTLYLDGSTPEKKRAEYVQAFQNNKADIFCISLKAGGQGLNLTAADYVIHLDPWWNPAVEDQASDRAHRMGQLRPVTIYRLIMQGSIEEKILKLHSTKRELADDILMNTDSAHKLSFDDLLQLLQ